MVDAANPFLDVRKNYFPIAVVDGWFPVVDELGSPLGIQIKPAAKLDYEALLRIETKASAEFGVTGILEVEFDRPGYYNVFQGDVPIDRPVSIRFADSHGNPVFVRRLFLTLYQPNYSLKEHLVNPADQLRQESLARLQTVLPFSDRPVQAALPTRLVGAQYELGFRDIAGERYVPAAPGVFVSGPFTIEGMPEVIRLDAEITGDVDGFLICRPYGIGAVSDPIVAQLLPGTALSFPDAWSPRGTLSKADLYLKRVFRSDDAVLTRFLLQVTKGA